MNYKFCIALILSLSGTLAWGPPTDKILLNNVKSLVFTSGHMTTGKRNSPVPQLTCVSGKGNPDCNKGPNTVGCQNNGVDDYGNVIWRCEVDLYDSYKIENYQVSCEGYHDSQDPYILKGSCGLTYQLEMTEKGKQRRLQAQNEQQQRERIEKERIKMQAEYERAEYERKSQPHVTETVTTTEYDYGYGYGNGYGNGLYSMKMCFFVVVGLLMTFLGVYFVVAVLYCIIQCLSGLFSRPDEIYDYNTPIVNERIRIRRRHVVTTPDVPIVTPIVPMVPIVPVVNPFNPPTVPITPLRKRVITRVSHSNMTPTPTPTPPMPNSTTNVEGTSELHFGFATTNNR